MYKVLLQEFELHQMVQQTTDSKFSHYGPMNTETGLPHHDKQQPVPVTAKKAALRDLQNENRILVPKITGSSEFSKDSDAIKVSGTKRTAPECLVSPPHQQSSISNAASGHLVYVRRKAEAELSKSSTYDDTCRNDICPQSGKLVDQDETTQQKCQMNETESCNFEAASIPRDPLMCFASQKPSVSPSLGKSGNIITSADSNYVTITSAIPSLAYPKKMNNQHWEERYRQLQILLKNLDQANQDSYIQMLRALSSVELSTHAVELEKRAIQLSLEEAREMQRVQHLNFLGKYSKNS